LLYVRNQEEGKKRTRSQAKAETTGFKLALILIGHVDLVTRLAHYFMSLILKNLQILKLFKTNL
jgi:hypothetical protein